MVIHFLEVGSTKMNRCVSSFLLFLALSFPLAQSQTEKNSNQPDLGDLSSQQLRDCYSNYKLCGARDDSDISAELASRLPTFATEELMDCFDDFDICGLAETDHYWPISDEIARRGDPHELLVRYWKERKWTIRYGIEDVAYHFDTPEVTAFMRRIISERRLTRREDHYWAVNYLSKKCDENALRVLSSGRYRYQGSLQYQTSVELFGKCRYRPAIPYLVDTAVYDWSFNIVIAADHSLHALYPGVRDFDRLDEMQRYFCGRAKQDGFRVKCSAK